MTADAKRKPAGGIGSIVASGKALAKNRATGLTAFLKVNRPGGFDCPGCAWPEPHRASHLEFCENGVKAVAHEITGKKVTPAFFREHKVADLLQWSDYLLEAQGRLTEPMVYRPEHDRYEPISWERAFENVGETLKKLDHPDRAVFYTSGRTSNEAAFLYQLFGRMYGTNNFPDCSNMCHESSGVALTESIGIGKGTVTLADFEAADAIFIFGQNPGTNHPRMLTELEKASKRGCRIVSVNPLVEPGLVSFVHPKKPSSVLFNRKTSISSLYLQPLVGGDLAVVKGMIKHVLERERGAPGRVLDRAFIEEHCSGFDGFEKDIDATAWEDIEANGGLSRERIMKAAEVYIEAKNVIVCWAMGLTQQKQAVGTIQTIVNLLLLRGNIGREGAGACPVRGHSNVQGDRTVGIVENPAPAFLEALGRAFDFEPPQKPGTNTVEAVKAMHAGKIKLFMAMGGNFARATPDREYTEAALRKLDLSVHVATKLNRSHLVIGGKSLILPCLGRSELDLRGGRPQAVTVEDSMSMVHASRGHRKPAGDKLLSEPAIVAGIAKATLGNGSPDWDRLTGDYGLIREKIAEVLPMFSGYNQRLRQPGGFYLGNSARDRDWRTATGKARFMAHPLPENAVGENRLRLMTVRSHDQYNTTIYGLDDRYRGIKGKRRVVFLNEEDMKLRNLKKGDLVDLTSSGEDGLERRAEKFAAIPYDIPKGCAAAYFPETNVLVPIDSYADRSFTPTSKFIPVAITASTA